MPIELQTPPNIIRTDLPQQHFERGIGLGSLGNSVSMASISTTLNERATAHPYSKRTIPYRKVTKV